jgi:hypothetical protein
MFKIQKGKFLKNKNSPKILFSAICTTILQLIVIFNFYSCDNALFDSGETTTKEITFNQKINGYEAESIFDILLVQDTINKILVTCGENLQPYVYIYLENDTVHLTQNTKQNWSRKYGKIKLEIHIMDDNFFMNIWEPISLTTQNEITMSSFTVLDWGVFSEIDIDINVDNCMLVNSPEHFGLFKAKGKSNYTFLWNRGSCKFQTDSLESTSCYVKHGGWGDVYVNVLENLTVSLESTGNIYYKGSPNTTIERRLSSGNLIKQD